jgi:serine/threonine protein kinase
MSHSLPSEKASFDSQIAQVADDFLDRISRGEQPAVSEYERCYPQIASLIPEVLSALQVMKQVRPIPNGLETTPEPTQFANGCLGDFRIVREVGRGGMGIVYEAEQISLGRRVALKVLPFASTLDAKQLQRFKNEALAAAHLHHQNIVPVYGVGSEDTVHYYAMQFIEGQTLASIIRKLYHSSGRQLDPENATAQTTSEFDHGPNNGDPVLVPDDTALAQPPKTVERYSALAEFSCPGSIVRLAYFRAVADLGVQAAEALEHAHERTVVHRDIKPSNLLVDCQGKLWITDFGLARFQQNSALTMTGDLLGTLRYMSPEQALGLNGQVDHRADIYGLGITLYELLTLAPAYPSQDRQEVLRQIGSDYVRRPRRVNKAVPVDLETIVLKAMEKSPENRYVTAQAMADDLRCFLEDRPIQAKRPRLVQRFARWRRRHKNLVRAGVLVMAIAVAAAVYSDVRVRHERELKDQQEKKALIEEHKAQISDAIAHTRAEEIYKQRVRSRQILNQVLVGLDSFVPLIENMWRQSEKRNEVRAIVDRELHYLHITLENENEPLARPETAKINRLVAQLHQLIGQHAEAELAYQNAIALLEKLLVDMDTDPEYHLQLYGTSPAIGKWEMRPATTNDAVVADRPAITYHQQQPVTDIDIHQLLAATYLERGANWLEQRQPHKALPFLRRSLGYLNGISPPRISPDAYSEKLAETQVKLGIAQEAMGQATEALKNYRQAAQLWESLLKKFPVAPRFKSSLDDTKRRLSHLLESWTAIA